MKYSTKKIKIASREIWNTEKKIIILGCILRYLSYRLVL